MKYKAVVLLIVLLQSLHNVVPLPEWNGENERDTDEHISVPNVSYNKKEEIFRRKIKETLVDTLKTKRSYNFVINYDLRNNDNVHDMKTVHYSHVDPLLKSEYYPNIKPELKLNKFGNFFRNSNNNFISNQVQNNRVENKTIFEPNMISRNIPQNAFTPNKIIPERNDFEYGPLKGQLKSTDIGVSSVREQDKPTTALGTQKKYSQDSLEYSSSSLGHGDELSYYYNNHSDNTSQKFYPDHSKNYTSETHSDVNYYDLGDFDDGEESALGLGGWGKKSKKYKESKNKPKQSYDQPHPQLKQQPFYNGYQQQPRNPVQNYVYPEYQNPNNQVPHKQYPRPPIVLPPFNPFQPPPNNQFQPPPYNQFQPPPYIPFQPPSKNRKEHADKSAKRKSKSTTYAPRPLNHKLNAFESMTASAPKLITPNIDTEIDDCEFGNTWTMNCYDCVCNGSTAICIRDVHCTPPPQNEPKLCKPYTSFPLDGSICHRCECNADGLPVCTFDYYACSRHTKQIFYRIKEGKIKYLRKTNREKVDSGYGSTKLLTTSQNTCPKVVIDFNVMKCQPRSKWTARCHICECDSEGQPLCVKILNCVPAPFGIPPKCKPGTILSIEGCQKCWCDDDGFPAGDIPSPKVQGLGAKTKTGKKALSAPLSEALNEMFASFLNTSFNDTNPLSPFSGSLEDHDLPPSLNAPVDDTDPQDSLPAYFEVTNISSYSASIEDNDASSPPTVFLDDADVNSPPRSLVQSN